MTATALPDLLVGLEHEMVRLFRTISHSKMHAVHQGVVVDKAGYQVLHKLAETGPVRAKELACQLGIDSSTTSRHLSTLAAAGLVERTPDPGDGRAWLLQPSEHGTVVLDQLREARTQRLHALTREWSAQDRTSFVRLLARFNDDLDALGDPPGPVGAG